MKINALFIALVIIYCVELTACSNQNSSEGKRERDKTSTEFFEIVGKWEDDIISTEFFENGTCFFAGPYTQRGTWRDLGNGNIVMVSGGTSITGSYKVENNILTISFENRDDTVLTCVENLRINETIGNDGDIGNIIPLDNRDAIEEQLGRMLETFDENTSDEEFLKILILMGEYKRLSEINDFREDRENEQK